MPFKPTVDPTTTLATQGVTGANLSSTLFYTKGMFTKSRILSFSVDTEYKTSSVIFPDSNAYAACTTAFSQVGGVMPFYLGQHMADDVIFTPEVIKDNTEYSFDLEVYSKESPFVGNLLYTVTIDSGTTATAESIATALFTEVTVTQAIPNVVGVDGTGSVTFSPAAGYQFVISNKTSNMSDAYTSTETVADMHTATMEYANELVGFITAEDHSELFTNALAVEVETSLNSQYPKTYRYSYAGVDTFTPYLDTSTDQLAKAKQVGYKGTHGEWHDQADTAFPEVGICVYRAQALAGVSTWKFCSEATIPVARHPLLQRPLTPTEVGYIEDRNCSVRWTENNVIITRGGKVFSGEWIDNIRLVAYMDDQVRTQGMQLLISNPNGKISFKTSDTNRVLNMIDSISSAAVGRNQLSGYIPAKLTSNPSFQNQVERDLDDIEWGGYISGAVYFLKTNGTLTYNVTGEES